MTGDGPLDQRAGAELCDLCGTVVTDGSELYALVPDSSVIHAHDPKLDGKRLVSACSREHLAELAEEHKRRPFVDEEQWSGKMMRALEQHPEGLSEDELAQATSLTPIQLHCAAVWTETQFLRWHLEHGGPGQE